MSKDGEKNIEDVEVGDYVLAKNPETGEQEYKKVSETFAHKEDVIIHVQIGNEDIQTTFNHPFYVVGKGFVRAGKLEVGDEILTSEGQKISIKKIEIEVLAEPVYVYNFTVEDFHTYFVSELGVWVHNACLKKKGGSNNTCPVSEGRSGYSNLKDSKSVGAGKRFTTAQKKKIIQQNMERNGGVIKSDLSGETLVPATKSQKGVTPNPLEVQIDHIEPRSKGGTNSYPNAQVLSRYENIKKI